MGTGNRDSCLQHSKGIEELTGLEMTNAVKRPCDLHFAGAVSCSNEHCCTCMVLLGTCIACASV